MQDKHGAIGGRYINQAGARGESAFCYGIGTPWPARVNNFKGPDVGTNGQVRTHGGHGYDLIIRDDDDGDHTFIEVTYEYPWHVIHGCIGGWEGREVGYRTTFGNDREEVTAVPQKYLRKVSVKDIIF